MFSISNVIICSCFTLKRQQNQICYRITVERIAIIPSKCVAGSAPLATHSTNQRARCYTQLRQTACWTRENRRHCQTKTSAKYAQSKGKNTIWLLSPFTLTGDEISFHNLFLWFGQFHRAFVGHYHSLQQVFNQITTETLKSSPDILFENY